jgi:hypothetical protein
VRILQSAELGERVHDLEQEVRALRAILGNTQQSGGRDREAPQEEGPRWVA